MLNLRTLVGVTLLCVQPPLAASQSTPAAGSVPTRSAISSDTLAVPKWVPVPIPPALYQKWRKYGQWDYKQRAFKYRDFTHLNFGATGSAAGFDEKALLALAEASKATPEDIKRLDDPELKASFAQDRELLETLRRMAEQDAHVMRIAPDFTWLNSSTKWPREDIGFSQTRWNEYRSLFKRLALLEGIVRTEDFPGTLFFVARVRGLCTGGLSAGYAYSTNALTPTVESPRESLDAVVRAAPSQPYAYVFKPLGAGWYAFYEVDW